MSSLIDDATRVAQLLAAQRQAAELFALIEAHGIVAAGVSETAASKAIRDLAATHLGVTRHWHKRVVRAGPNTLEPYRVNPPERIIGSDDIVFLDLGPIFQEWEADFGRTYVLGNDLDKLRLRDDLAVIFDAGRRHFEAEPGITGEQLWNHMLGLAATAGWEWGGTIAGHVVGQFPHDEMPGHDRYSRVAPGNDRPMRGTDSGGNVAHWILEVHLVDRDRRIGGFFEELLDVGH